MPTSRFLFAAAATTAAACLTTVAGAEPRPIDTEELLIDYDDGWMEEPVFLEDEPIQPVPYLEELYTQIDLEPDPALIALGRQLFHDPRLSTDNTLSCASCHDLRYGGIDRAISATGVRGQVGPINTPTVFNAVFNISQFWDGRARDLSQQAGGPPMAEGEMGSTWPEILGKLRQDSGIVDQFLAAFPEHLTSAEDITSDHVLEAIAQFEATLITPDSDFDAYLRGDVHAIDDDAKVGYVLFKEVGCSKCHFGVSVGGGTFQRLGVMNDYFGDHAREVDLGRFNVTQDEADKHVFKVPNLRNVELTGPYYHDGSKATLHDAVDSMGRVQLDTALDNRQIEQIVGFLETLTGTYEGRRLDEVQNTTLTVASRDD